MRSFSSGAMVTAMRQNAGLTIEQLAQAVDYNPKFLKLMEAAPGLVRGRMPRKILRYLMSLKAHERTVTFTISGRQVPSTLPISAEFACGAKTRKGTPCKMKVTWANGRCKLHGGLSTGVLTEAGKVRIREAQRRRRERERNAALLS